MKTNVDIFPEDFCFQLTNEEVVILTSQNCNLNKLDIQKFNKQYPTLKLTYHQFHKKVEEIVGDISELEFEYAITNSWHDMERLELYYHNIGKWYYPNPLDKDLLEKLKHNVLVNGNFFEQK